MTEITSTEALRAVYPQPNDLAVRKELSFVDRHAREFIARSPFVVVATSDADGWPDASPRGDAPGFVEVPDEHRLLLPDRPGNNRLDSFQNLVANPKIALIFLVPRRLETLRVNGTARIRTDPELCGRLSVRGKPARAVVEVTATSVYFQCGKSVVRSGLWLPERWPSIDGMATFAEALADQIEGVNAAAAEENLAAAYRDRLY
ncbi:MAG: MSMEG_1061 family FMN-dependent PPOX-type flavoprotein [Hyphomicrobiaceae bacterium]